MGNLDPSVAMQILRRGGLRGDKKVDPKEVDGRVAQLRAQTKDDQQSKQQDGGKPEGKSKAKAKAKAGKAKAGWQLPPDFHRLSRTQLPPSGSAFIERYSRKIVGSPYCLHPVPAVPCCSSLGECPPRQDGLDVAGGLGHSR